MIVSPELYLLIEQVVLTPRFVVFALSPGSFEKKLFATKILENKNQKIIIFKINFNFSFVKTAKLNLKFN